jgi:hypothetical protein
MTHQTPEQILKSLDKPGAGIPWYFRLANRILLKPLVVRKFTWQQCEENFLSVNEKLKRELEGLTQEQLEKRILVSPIVGIEDSSRYWSIAMTLRHLCIVHPLMKEVVIRLAKEETIPVKVDTASVKPELEKNSSQAVQDYFSLIQTILPDIKNSIPKEFGLTKTFSHPWFGEMTAKDWFWLLGAHTGIHLKQIRKIKEQLPLI